MINSPPAPPQSYVFAAAAAAAAVCQEGVRALRQGDHDAWNSFWAGAATGAVLTRSACE
jgi:hypothetical protein